MTPVMLAPVVGLALLDAEGEQEHADGAERDADPVEAVAVGLQHRHEPPREDEADDADRAR